MDSSHNHQGFLIAGIVVYIFKAYINSMFVVVGEDHAIADLKAASKIPKWNETSAGRGMAYSLRICLVKDIFQWKPA